VREKRGIKWEMPGWIAFEAGSQLSRLEASTFSLSRLTSVLHPALVPVIVQSVEGACTGVEISMAFFLSSEP
jgi:hypothetical protein